MAKAIQFLSPIQVDILYTNFIESSRGDLNTVKVRANLQMSNGFILTTPTLISNSANISTIQATTVNTKNMQVINTADISTANITNLHANTITVVDKLIVANLTCGSNLQATNLFGSVIKATYIECDSLQSSFIETTHLSSDTINTSKLYVTDYNDTKSIAEAIYDLERALQTWDFKRGYGLYGRINDDDNTMGTLVGFIAQYGPLVYGYIYNGEQLNATALDSIYTNLDVPGPASPIYITWNGKDSKHRSIGIRDLDGHVDLHFNGSGSGKSQQHWSYFVYQPANTKVQWLF